MNDRVKNLAKIFVPSEFDRMTEEEMLSVVLDNKEFYIMNPSGNWPERLFIDGKEYLMAKHNEFYEKYRLLLNEETN